MAKSKVKTNKIAKKKESKLKVISNDNVMDGFINYMKKYNLSSLEKKESEQKFMEHTKFSFNRPVANYWNQIVNSILNHQLIIISADTGAGKTTQVPKMILHALAIQRDKNPDSSLKVLITQPKVLAVEETSFYVAKEMGLELGKGEVGLQTGVSKNIADLSDDKFKMIFMTDGIVKNILTKQTDLSNIGAIIVDEVHERNDRIDIILLLLKEILLSGKNKHLKVIIMSATVDQQKFAKYFTGISKDLFKVPGKLYPVQTYYYKNFVPSTPIAALGASVKKALKICGRTRNPADIVVFLSSVRETQEGCKLFSEELENIIGNKLNNNYLSQEMQDKIRKYNPVCFYLHSKSNKQTLENMLKDKNRHFSNKIMAVDKNLYKFGLLKEGSHFIYPVEAKEESGKWTVKWSSGKVTKNTEVKHHIKIVFSTNLAEASVTVDNVGYVVDTGRALDKLYDPVTNANSLPWNKIAKSSADQRKGRAGRTRPGKCFRLYTKEDFKNMEDYPLPDILTSNLSQTLIDLLEVASKYYDNPLNNLLTLLGKLIDVPSKSYIKAGMNELNLLGIIEEKRISNFGKLMMKSNISPPKLARIYVISKILNVENKVLPTACLLFKINKVDELFQFMSNNDWEVYRKKNKWIFEKSDCEDFSIIKNIMDEAMKKKESELFEWCSKNKLNYINILGAIKDFNKNKNNISRIESMIEYDVVKDDIEKALKDIKYDKVWFPLYSGFYWNVAYRTGDESYNNYRIFGNNLECRLSRQISCSPTWDKNSSFPEFVIFNELFSNRDQLNINLYSSISIKNVKLLEPNYWNVNRFSNSAELEKLK